jgi:hypothetical protein
MKRFVVREVETLKTTAALYDCDCCCPDFCIDGNVAWCCGPNGNVVIIGAN